MAPQFSGWMGKSGKFHERTPMSLILPCSSLTASYAKCLQHEDVTVKTQALPAETGIHKEYYSLHHWGN